MADVDRELLQEVKKLNSNLSELEKTLKNHTESQYEVGSKLGDIAIVINSLARDLKTKE